MKTISVIVPVYKSEKVLRNLYIQLVSSLETITPDFEIIFIEDCGGDGSWDVIREIAAKDTRIKGVKLSRNFGQHAATICGFKIANGKWVVTLDDDLEQNPEDISKLLQRAQDGFSLIYGVYPKRSHSFWRNLTSNIARKLFNTAIPSLNCEYTSFRLLDGKLAKYVCTFDSPFPFIDGYLSWITNNYSTVEVSHDNRKYGKSNYTLRKLILHTINIFVTFSDLPLKLASWIGLGAFFVGIFWLVAIILAKILGGITVSGFASIMASIILFGGVQLFILGIFGEYLGRINFKSSKKPLYIVSEETKAN